MGDSSLAVAPNWRRHLPHVKLTSFAVVFNAADNFAQLGRKLAGCTPSIPGLGLITAPFFIYSMCASIKEYFHNIRIAKTFREKTFWAVTGAAKVGQAANEILKPSLLAVELINKAATSAPAYVAARNTLPILTLALGALGMFASSWNLARTIQEYTHFRNVKDITQVYPAEDEEIKKIFFERYYQPYYQKLDNISPEQLRGKLKKAIRFSIFDHSISLAASTIAVAASILFMISPYGFSLPVMILLATSSGLGLVPLITKQFFKEKKPLPPLPAPDPDFHVNLVDNVVYSTAS